MPIILYFFISYFLTSENDMHFMKYLENDRPYLEVNKNQFLAVSYLLNTGGNTSDLIHF